MKKNYLQGLVVFLVHHLICLNALSQASYVFDYSNSVQFMQDISGKPVYLKVEYNVEGTPFYPNEYYKANLVIRNGKTYTDVFVKFNLQENLLLYKLPDGTEMSVTNSVLKITFTDTSNGGMMLNKVFESGFTPGDKDDDNIFYEVIESGKIKLLKRHHVSFSDRKGYGQASITRVFEQTEVYYIYFPNGEIKKLEKGKDAFLSLFSDKKKDISDYIDEQKLKCRKESDWKKIVAYYDSLFKSP